MSNCKDKIGYTCSKRVNSRCVDYEGEISECSELDSECRIHTVHEVLEDSSRQLTKVCSELDLSEVDKGCLQFETEDPKLPEVIGGIINKLCEEQDTNCDMYLNTPIACMELDYGCLVDECGEAAAPQNIKELFQLLINQICSSTPDRGEPLPSEKE